MLILRKRESLIWLDLLPKEHPELRVQVPPLSIGALRAAESAGVDAMTSYMREVGAEKHTDLEPEQAKFAEGKFAEARIVNLASRIVAWEGVGDETGVAIPPTPETIALFVAEPAVARAFHTAYEESAAPQFAEANFSASSGTGEPAAGRNIAKDAGAAAETAPVA